MYVCIIRLELRSIYWSAGLLVCWFGGLVFCNSILLVVYTCCRARACPWHTSSSCQCTKYHRYYVFGDIKLSKKTHTHHDMVWHEVLLLLLLYDKLLLYQEISLEHFLLRKTNFKTFIFTKLTCVGRPWIVSTDMHAVEATTRSSVWWSVSLILDPPFWLFSTYIFCPFFPFFSPIFSRRFCWRVVATKLCGLAGIVQEKLLDLIFGK